MFTPKLEILPSAQRRLWDELKDTPQDFVLYGGTALALRLGHRHSEDFDFFSNVPFTSDVLPRRIPYLQDAEISQSETDTLTAIVDRGGPVKVSFFGGLNLNRVQDPEFSQENGIPVASLLDLGATKLATVQQRAQARDYQDIAAIVASGISLTEMLAAAVAVYGKAFNAALSLKALTYFDDGDLPNLSPKTQELLRQQAIQVKLTDVPAIPSKPGLLEKRGSAK
jgi:predicted nucleotidyltransferase component of viral defense system